MNEALQVLVVTVVSLGLVYASLRPVKPPPCYVNLQAIHYAALRAARS